MVDSCGFKISFTKRAKANRCRRGGGGGGGGGGLKLSVLIEAYLQPCVCDNLKRSMSLFQHTRASTILIGFRLVSPLHLP